MYITNSAENSQHILWYVLQMQNQKAGSFMQMNHSKSH